MIFNNDGNQRSVSECSPFQYFPSGSLAGYNSHKKWRSNSFYEDNNSPPFYSNSMVAVTTKCYQCSDHPKDRMKYSSCASDIIPIIQCQSDYCYVSPTPIFIHFHSNSICIQSKRHQQNLPKRQIKNPYYIYIKIYFIYSTGKKCRRF